MFQSVTVDCYNASSAPGTNKQTSYTYNSAVGTNNTVVDGDKPTVLDSLIGTGTNMTAGLLSASASATADTIPGLSGAGPGTDGHASESADSGSATATDGSGTSTGSGAQSTCTSSFCQGSSSSSSKSSAEKLSSQERVLKGSVFAGIVAVVAVMAL